MALGYKYLKFNTLDIPNPIQFDIGFENLENVAVSEAGTDLAIVSRLQKRTFTCSFQCTSAWLDKFRTMCGLTSGTLTYLGENIPCRARIETATLSPYSEHVLRTDGLWTVSVTFTEV